MESEVHGFPLGGYLDQLIDELRALLPRAVKHGDADAVHEARVATRRLKAAVDLYRPVISGKEVKPFRKTLRQLRRRLGPLRDLDVMLGHLRAIASRSATRRAAAQWMMERLDEHRAAARKAAATEIAPARTLSRLGAWWGIREELDEACDATESLLAESVHTQLADFKSQANRLAGDEPEATRTEPSRPFDAHALRIAGKSLRYTLEMARVQGVALPAEVIRTFKKMQDALGLWHDEVVLAERAMQMSADAMLAHHDADLQDAVLLLARSAVTKSKQQLARFAGLWREHGGALTGMIERSFRLTQSVSESQTDPDPARSPEPSPSEDAEQDSRGAA